MGQSNVAKPRRKYLPLGLALLTVVVLGVPLFPLAIGLNFREGTGSDAKVTRTGVATVTSCESRFYGLMHQCTGSVRWSSQPSQAAVVVIRSTHELSGEVAVEQRERPDYRGDRNGPEVVSADHPVGGTREGLVPLVFIALVLGIAGVVFWLTKRKLRRPLPDTETETPGEAGDLRAAQVARGKARRRRRKRADRGAT